MPFLIANWRLVLEVLVIGALAIVLTFQTTAKRHYKAKAEAVQAEFDGFKLKVAQLGEAAKADAKRQETENADRLRKADAAAADARATLARWVSRYGAGGRGVPESSAPATGACPAGLVCFDGPQLDAALRGYRSAVAGLVGEGEEAVIDRGELAAGWPK
jgi:hypothetical protein